MICAGLIAIASRLTSIAAKPNLPSRPMYMVNTRCVMRWVVSKMSVSGQWRYLSPSAWQQGHLKVWMILPIALTPGKLIGEAWRISLQQVHLTGLSRTERQCMPLPKRFCLPRSQPAIHAKAGRADCLAKARRTWPRFASTKIFTGRPANR